MDQQKLTLSTGNAVVMEVIDKYLIVGKYHTFYNVAGEKQRWSI